MRIFHKKWKTAILTTEKKIKQKIKTKIQSNEIIWRS